MQNKVVLAIFVIATLTIGCIFGKPLAKTSCPRNKPLVSCFIDPCTLSTCPGDPTATCTSNYCGGCYAVWTSANGKAAKCSTTTTTTTPCNIVSCFVNPCQGKTCPAYPDAKCVPNYCGTCLDEWYDANGVKVQCNSNI